MTMAAAMQSRTAEAPARSKAGRIGQVDIVADLDEAEAVWRAFEESGHLFTPYQRFDLLGPWQQLVGKREGARPFVVIARDVEYRPLVLLPLSLRQAHGVRTACFMGGKHTTFNMGLWNVEFAAQAVLADLDALFAPLREHVDVLSLTQQPKRWHDQQNPFALLPRQSSVNGCPLLAMEPGGPPASRISNSFRRRLKSKEKKLQALAGYRYHLATTDADIVRLLDWFFRVKPARMAEQKLPNVFAEPGVEQFIRSACLARRGEGRVIDVHALECDEEVIAIFAGVADGQRLSMMFNTYTMSENARYSPGLILMRYIIDRCAERGYRSLDLGIGSDDYKRMFCKDDEDIFDSFVPLTSRGRLAAVAMSSLNRGKRLVKQNQMLLDLARSLRQAFG
ncbi:GNAT family N-acetyltransferase [Bradyrhizobium sp. 180]|uniref:GNAT family N-acetyltransferase n=1 Tax=unclassified Bradyrhizobium TaxID=2631580 RepID=UPI001FF706CE|nr:MULTISPECIES: GNAT family N-acetyltransferase [unclassified Bradyrhizobium]MCK1420666.1 GNAT family N-acetyltransferase [Bradyrhizobium sp. CW12]MCK1489777.1 GNAT family N-acetyltransferase [Bradyrhizobium sp. 180]MCK1532439.1 GNAT family N-acetyltransferase [Bradyrhizobium sp. 182]MCK1595597.1 GNAT family N-acetyltransferase [Bradyrhizobium sp. 164]MCK1618460.1 GNAT family N-acetyltransferase [Bradyrhizobium sp. 159]